MSGSTSIANELVKNYDGELYYHKHSDYHMFSRHEKKLFRNYTCFAVVRDPIDLEFTMFNKYMQNRKNQFTSPERFLENGGYVSKSDRFLYNEIKKKNLSFNEYLYLKFKYRPYNNQLALNAKFIDKTLSFSNLNEDFLSILKDLGLTIKNDLPHNNKTRDKILRPEISKELKKKVFSPFIFKYNRFFNTNEYPKISPYQKLLFYFYNILWILRKTFINNRFLSQSKNNKLIYWK